MAYGARLSSSAPAETKMDDFYEQQSVDTPLAFAGLTNIFVPWYVVKQYSAAAEVQMGRILDGLREAERRGRAHDQTWSRFQRQAFVDIHGYFTCWRQVHTMLAVIDGGVLDAGVKAVYAAHRPTLQRYRDARDHLEHFDERLRGQRRRNPVSTASGDLGNLAGSDYTFHGEIWDVSPASLDLLLTIVGEFESALRTYALQEARARRESLSTT